MTDQDNSPGLSTEQRERVVAAAKVAKEAADAYERDPSLANYNVSEQTDIALAEVMQPAEAILFLHAALEEAEAFEAENHQALLDGDDAFKEMKARAERAEETLSALQQENERLREALNELVAVVRGECPSLLNEDSGGSPRLNELIANATQRQGGEHGPA